jgi:hypothetical protein
MVKYVCDKCNKEFIKLCDFKYHTEKRKKSCISVIKEEIKNIHVDKIPHNPTQIIQIPHNPTQNEKEYKCMTCNKIFSRNDSLKRHMSKYCNKKINDENLDFNIDINKLDIDDKTKKILLLLKKQNDFLVKQVNMLVDKKSISKTINNTSNDNSITNNNTLNNTINNNNTIILAHGKEDLSKIELEAIMGCMSTFKHREIIPNITKYVYLNDKKPENKNFCVVDTARNKCKYFDGKKWVIGKTTDKVTKIFDNIHNMLTDPFEKEHINKTIEFIKANPKKYNEKWIKVSNTYLKSLYDEDDKENMENKLKVLEELKLIFFNNKDEILKLT